MLSFFVRNSYRASGAFVGCVVEWTTTAVNDIGITPFETLDGVIASTTDTTATRGISIPYVQPAGWSEQRQVEVEISNTTIPTAVRVYEMSNGSIVKTLWSKDDVSSSDRLTFRLDEQGDFAGYVNDTFSAISGMNDATNDFTVVFENEDKSTGNNTEMTVETFGDTADQLVESGTTDGWCG